MDKRLSTPPVYVIVLNWNGWRDTLACLASLERLNYPNYEVIVVDNASTNDSETRIREAYPNVTLLQTGKNLGFAGGNNVGTRYALEQGAEYVWLLNNDTVVDPGALAAMVKTAQRDAGVGVVGAVLYHAHGPDGIQYYGGGRVRAWVGTGRPFTAPVPDDELHYVTGSSLLVRREVLERVGLLDEDYFMYWEDLDLSVRVRRAGWKLAVASEARIWHKEHAMLGRENPVLFAYYNASAVRFFKKHSSLPMVPILIGVGGRFLKRIVRRDWKGARAVLQGALSGWR